MPNLAGGGKRALGAWRRGVSTSAGGRQGRPSRPESARGKRLTKALRDNLKRRKGQARDRGKEGPERPTLLKPGAHR